MRTSTGNHNVPPVRRFGAFCCSIAVHGSSEKVEGSIRACGINIEILIIVAHGGGSIILAEEKAFAVLNVSPKPKCSSFRRLEKSLPLISDEVQSDVLDGFPTWSRRINPGMRQS